MSWNTLSRDQLLKEGFNPSEQATLTAVAGAVDAVPDILTTAIGEVRGVIESTGVDLGDPATIPDMLRPHVIAMVRWRWLIAFPQFKQLQTEERRKAAERADKILDDIAKGDRAIEPPDGSTEVTSPITGNSGSETKVNMRTHV